MFIKNINYVNEPTFSMSSIIRYSHLWYLPFMSFPQCDHVRSPSKRALYTRDNWRKRINDKASNENDRDSKAAQLRIDPLVLFLSANASVAVLRSKWDDIIPSNVQFYADKFTQRDPRCPTGWVLDEKTTCLPIFPNYVRFSKERRQRERKG